MTLREKLPVVTNRDRQRVNMNDKWSVLFYCERFNVTREQLQRAVDAAGPMAEHVRQYLRAKTLGADA